MKNRFLLWLCISLSLQCSAPNEVVSYHFPSPASLPVQVGLPSPFLGPSGTPIETSSDWDAQRIYLKAMVAEYMYGHMPSTRPTPIVTSLSSITDRGGQFVREKLLFTLERNGQQCAFRVGIQRPMASGKFPVIIKNTIYALEVDEIEDTVTRRKWLQQGRDLAQKFVYEEAQKRQYVMCNFVQTDISSDYARKERAENRVSGIFPLYPEYDWGTIAAWAWAYQVIIDYLEEQAYIDADKIIATGHSRGGKAALCAGIYDERIAITAPNSSGAGGTASLRFFDEAQRKQTIEHHIEHFPHWWTPGFYEFAGLTEKLPFDAHTLKAIIAPRALLNTHARHDFWANPYGTYLTYLGAQPVFEWLGVPENQAIHWRDGGHQQDSTDWMALFEFGDFIFRGNALSGNYHENPYPDAYAYKGYIDFVVPGGAASPSDSSSPE